MPSVQDLQVLLYSFWGLHGAAFSAHIEGSFVLVFPNPGSFVQTRVSGFKKAVSGSCI